jgi:hypothetical protein
MHKMRALSFSTTFARYIFRSDKNLASYARDARRKAVRSSRKFPLLFHSFDQIWNLSTNFNNLPGIKFHENPFSRFRVILIDVAKRRIFLIFQHHSVSQSAITGLLLLLLLCRRKAHDTRLSLFAFITIYILLSAVRNLTSKALALKWHHMNTVCKEDGF